MASVSRALRKFIASATRAFHGARAAFDVTSARWKFAVTTLRRKARTLASSFASLRTTRRVTADGRELVMLGEIEGREFTKMLRLARSVEAFESATRTTLSPVARGAFGRLDDIARSHFPDVSLARRTEYVRRWRDALAAKRAIDDAERVLDAAHLERIVRSDSVTLKRVNALLKSTSRTRRLLYVGGAVTVTGGVGLPYLMREIARYARDNSGCFMYTNDLTNGVRKCRVVGCTCPMPLLAAAAQRNDTADGGPLDSKIVAAVACDETDLWETMRVRRNECARADERPAPYCVHCDWDESDPTSVDFVDKERLSENAMVRCERVDALDALNEVIGATVDDAFDNASRLTRFAGDSFAWSASAVLRWLLVGAIVLLVLLAAAFAVWRRVRPRWVV